MAEPKRSEFSRAFAEDGACKTHIGGQALIEGVMMRGKYNWAVAVRAPDGGIYVEEHDLSSGKEKNGWMYWPFVRGCRALVESLTLGFKALEIAAMHAFEDEEDGEGECASKCESGDSAASTTKAEGSSCATPAEAKAAEAKPKDGEGDFGHTEMMISMILVMLTMSRASGQRVVEVLDEKSTIEGGSVTEVKNGEIRFDNVSFRYGDEGSAAALTDITLTIPSGATVGILGGTGSAKSTLVQLIPRLYDVSDGSLSVGGVDVRDYALDALRNNVAMVLQKNVLFSGTVKENLRWGNPDATDEQLQHACRLAQADDFLQSFPDGYDTVLEQGGTNVSGGQKQRLCIARALLKNHKILILDDSTSAVDTRTDALIRKAFREELPDTTKLIIAQRIASVQESDMIVVLEGGRIAAVGTHEELLEKSAMYREIYESQQKGGEDE